MKVIGREEILSHFDSPRSIEAIRGAFIKFEAGQAQVPPVVHLAFSKHSGECHIKSGHLQGDDVFVVKLATGFYKNPLISLPSSNGFIAIISAETGLPLALLCDEGALTDLRTALAGALATKACGRANSKILGVVGSGIQAGLQARFIAPHFNLEKIIVWARNEDKANQLGAKLRDELSTVTVEVVQSAEQLCAKSDLIVTTTASTEPVLLSEWIRPGTHITAVGADSPGKQELDTAIFRNAHAIVVDSKDQCIEHGETSNAISAGDIDANALTTFGSVLTEGYLERTPHDITVADLTGVAIQDIAISKCIWESISNSEAKCQRTS